jgi:hypothetical protein
MRKVALAVAALTGAALTTNAAMLKVSDQTFANFGIKMQIYGQSLEDGANGGEENAFDFAIQNARIYFSGQLNPIVQFGANFDFTLTSASTSHEGTATTRVRDAFINFHFLKELNIMAGYYRVPFSRTTLVDRYNTIFMPKDGSVHPLGSFIGVYKDQLADGIPVTFDAVLGGPTLGNMVATLPLVGDESSFARDAGVTVWGDILDGMFKYYAGLYDGAGDHNVGDIVGGIVGGRVERGKDNLGYTIRLEFTPTMYGFQPEKGYLHKETYLGKKKVLTVGAAYSASKLEFYDGSTKYSYDFKSWTVDANWEQKIGSLVPKLEAGYVYNDVDELGDIDEIKTWYIKVGTLFDQQIWLGKLGLYVKYQDVDVDFKNDEDISPAKWTVTVPYYLADQNAKIVLQWDHYDYDKKGMDPRSSEDDTNDDITLAFQVQF